jgi:hypothetical protein
VDSAVTGARTDSSASTAYAHATCVIPTVRMTDCADPTMAHRHQIASVPLRKEVMASASTRIGTRATMPGYDDVEAQVVQLEVAQLGMRVSRITATVESLVLRWGSV